MKLTTPIMIALAPFVATPSYALDDGRKMRSLFPIAAALVIFGCATTSAQNAVPSNIANAVADQDRPDEDRQRDADRKPAEVLTFVSVPTSGLSSLRTRTASLIQHITTGGTEND